MGDTDCITYRARRCLPRSKRPEPMGLEFRGATDSNVKICDLQLGEKHALALSEDGEVRVEDFSGSHLLGSPV